jgi:uncharacterized membrane protein YkoI
MSARKVAILVVAAVIAMTGFASADQKDREQRDAVKRAKVSLTDAIAIAQKLIPDGKVVDTDIETIKGVVQYAIEIDKDGVKTVFVDLQTGNVLHMGPKQPDGAGDDDD